MNDRRTGARHVPREGTVVRVKFKDRKQFESCWVKDISRNGIFLRTQTPVDLFGKVVVVLEMPGGDTVELAGQVVRIVPPEQAGKGVAAGMGVQFADLTPDKRQKLESYLSGTEPMVAAPRPFGKERSTRAAQAQVAVSMEEMIRGLRRVVWASCDAAVLAKADYYELLGVEADAKEQEIRNACEVLRTLLDGDPSGAHSARVSGLLEVLEQIEACLCDPSGRARYESERRRSS